MTAPSKSPRSVVLAGAAVVAAAASVWAFLPRDRPDRPPWLPRGEPSFEDVKHCPFSSDAALAHSRAAAEAAHVHRARYFVDPGEALVAARLLAEASVCARESGDPARALRWAETLSQWRAEILEEYRRHRRSLVVALVRGDKDAIRSQARWLRHVVGAAGTPLLDVLTALERRADGAAR